MQAENNMGDKIPPWRTRTLLDIAKQADVSMASP